MKKQGARQIRVSCRVRAKNKKARGGVSRAESSRRLGSTDLSTDAHEDVSHSLLQVRMTRARCVCLFLATMPPVFLSLTCPAPEPRPHGPRAHIVARAEFPTQSLPGLSNGPGRSPPACAAAAAGPLVVLGGRHGCNDDDANALAAMRSRSRPRACRGTRRGPPSARPGARPSL